MIIYNHKKLEQLECLRSEDTPPLPPFDKVKVKEFGKISNFETNITSDTPSEVAW